MMINKSVKQIAIWSALLTGFFVLLFGITIFIERLTMFAYASSIGIAISFLIMTISNSYFTPEDRNIHARIARSFAVIYCVLACMVYYVQISFVRLGSPSPDALSIVAYAPPRTAFFALDILGYFFMSLSVLFISFTIINNRLLKTSLLIMGLWGTSCIVVPLLPFLYESTDSSSDVFGIIVLALWSILFIPLSILLARYYSSFNVDGVQTKEKEEKEKYVQK